ncbi:sulfotransferase [Thioclava sp. GXIMD4215]|uniref:sulfotransferase family protein n=1 Tax=Thioclava sp. GXIMD4215 TaxID=3131928 RepID=UPI00311AED6F
MAKTKDIVFVYGALRSGTTVFRLMLDHHPMIANPGELDFLFDFLWPDPSHPTQWRYDIDKMRLDWIFQAYGLIVPADKDGLDLLENFLYQIDARYGSKPVMTINIHRNVDKVRAIFPEVKLIHMLRDPRDVARSSIGMGWSCNIYYGVDHWIKTEAAWDKAGIAPDDPNTLQLTYENLFRDIDSQLHRVCDFLDVPWDEEMLSYHRNSTYDPPDPKLIEQWRHKCSAEDIALLEGKARALLVARGYVPAGEGHVPGSAEKLTLFLRQRMFQWRGGIEKLGAGLFFGEKLTRHLKLHRQHRALVHQINLIKQKSVR